MWVSNDELMRPSPGSDDYLQMQLAFSLSSALPMMAQKFGALL